MICFYKRHKIPKKCIEANRKYRTRHQCIISLIEQRPDDTKPNRQVWKTKR